MWSRLGLRMRMQPVGKRLMSTKSGWTKPRRRIATGLGVGTVTVSALYLTNDSFRQGVHHTRLAGKRIATVTVACTRCFRHYYRVLNKEYDTEEEYSEALAACHTKCANITRKAIENNAGLFIKLGQHIAALTYIFPDEWTSAMIPLQDRCPTSDYESISEMVERDTGKKMDELFDEFDRTPLGTASLAQVHRARLKDGQQVAVKVQHPSLQEFVPLDVLLTQTVFNLIDYFFKDYPLVWLSDEMQSSIFIELDFREEAKNAQQTQEYFRDYYNETALRVPDVVWAERRILVMEFLCGERLDNIEFLDANNIARHEVSSCLSHIFNNMIFTPGVGLHCDPHPGNMAIISSRGSGSGSGAHNFELILYDHGLYRNVPTQVRRDYAHFWLALLDGDEEQMKYYAKRFAGIDESQFQLFSAAITGRDFDNATSNVVSRRTKDEVKNMTAQVSSGGLISDIMVLLHSMPRIVLLILKTNDLTRYLDEKLNNPLGPERTFLIMATYCARTVYNESRERIAKLYPNIYSLRRVFEEFKAWWVYIRREGQLTIYDVGMKLKSVY